VLILTGHLLKDPEFTLKFHRGDLLPERVRDADVGALNRQRRPPIVVDANVDAVLRILEQTEKAGLEK
jgi:threonine synthase